MSGLIISVSGPRGIVGETLDPEVAVRYAAAFVSGLGNVTGVMRACDAVFGGEGNGGPVDPRVGYVRDSFVGIALILDAMAARERLLPGQCTTPLQPRRTIRRPPVSGRPFRVSTQDSPERIAGSPH